MRARCILLLPLLAWTAAFAQNPGQNSPQPAPGGRDVLQKDEQAAPGRKNQRIERIHHEDAGSRIDELRYGGQTQSITVQPKANVPEYQVQPPDQARSRPGENRDGLSSAGGQRVWNVLKF